MLGLLQDASREMGKTVVLITHNQAFCSIADRVIHIRGGRAASIERNASPLDAAALEW